MKKVFIFLVTALLVLDACQAREIKVPVATEEAVAEQLSPDELVKRVEDIFTTVYKVYAYEDSLRNLDQLQNSPTWENRKNFNADYCSAGLNDLFNQVDEIDSMYHSDEMGFFDADYWIMAQDYSSELHVSGVKVVEMSGNEAIVDLMIHDFGSARPMRLKMVYEDSQWKIDSFIDNDYDLKKSMEEYVLNEKKTRE